MREVSQEKGRKQLLGVIDFLERQQAGGGRVVTIGNAYTSAARTAYAACSPKYPAVNYDAVLGFEYPSPQVRTTCLIESKVAYQAATKKKLPRHFEDFVLSSYCVLRSWPDKLEVHRPLFLFVPSVGFPSKLLNNGRLNAAELNRVLAKRGVSRVHFETAKRLEDFVRVFIFDDWMLKLTDR